MPQVEESLDAQVGLRTQADVESDLELLAQHFARLSRDLERRIEGVRADFEVALLEQVAGLVRRCERLEALVAEHVGSDVAVALLAAAHRER